LLDGRPRSADVAAVTDCELMVINRRDFVPLMHDHPEVAFKFIDILCERLRRTNEQVERVMFLDLPTRLAKVLIQLAQTGEASAEGRKISMTQREIGQMIGMSRESTNKQLRNWEERKWIRLERGSVVVVALDKLAAVTTAGDGAKAQSLPSLKMTATSESLSPRMIGKEVAVNKYVVRWALARVPR
jgi:CRP/FNR family transcriptional regulator, cyclic AMP receptor protein